MEPASESQQGLRQAARSLHAELIELLDPERLFADRLILDGSVLRFDASSWDLSAYRKIVVIAIGKASIKMARAAECCFGEVITDGLVVCDALLDVDSPWLCILGGHPYPNKESLRAGQAALDLLASCDSPDCMVMFLISGGGSALCEVPREGMSLDALVAAHRDLVTGDLPIAEINRARSTLSQTKAGGLARAAGRAKQVTIYLSDVEPGDLGSIASGPSMRRGSHADEHLLLLDTKGAVELVAAHLQGRNDLHVEMAEDPGEEGVEALAERLLVELRRLKDRHPSSRLLLLSMGESSCPIVGKGIGGRNQELVLRMVIDAGTEFGTDFALLSAGSDGIDGNSPAAGAVVDHTTLARAKRLGLDPKSYLQVSDAYSFFDALGDLVVTGASGTNLRDLRLLLAE